MPKLGMEPIRRRQLIEATVAAIHEQGLAEATVKQISARAGVSSGIIHHYFGGKDALLAATMRAMLRDLRREVNTRLATAQTPEARLEAVIEASFSIDQFSGAVQTAWLSFWAQTPHSPSLARLARLYLRRLRSTLRHALRGVIADEAAVEEAADGLAAIIDGLWLTAAVAPRSIDPAAARRIAWNYVRAQIALAERDGIQGS
ncbi:transcriptional regulator BetI [Marivibrio halodurans]|uniref:HTH-type transcriptional regulator BetI n=1 Tax=Marivibrio halodurans TaxID=2039722 RepID=A0A8J7S311_9PROT|nr:transcriptional regulator BetI [Marivibrio halodurans]MBP5857759.1 transcriptional regulator BetI [Marivibrio halodurans]